MLMNHYYPNSVPVHKMIMMPRNNMDSKMNLKKLQEALLLHNIKSINFDVFFSLFRYSESLKCPIWITGNSLTNFINILTNLPRTPRTTKRIHQNSVIKIKTKTPPIQTTKISLNIKTILTCPKKSLKPLISPQVFSPP